MELHSYLLADNIYDTLSAILREVFDDDTLVASPDLSADQVDGWDSFAHMRVIVSVEEHFNVTFTGSDISTVKNVGDLAELTASKLSH